MPFPQPISLLAGRCLQDTWSQTFGLVSSAEMVPQLAASKLQQHFLHLQSSQMALVYHHSNDNDDDHHHYYLNTFCKQEVILVL